MTVEARQNPFPHFTDTAGLPLAGGYVYFGEPNQDPRSYPVAVYYDREMTLPATQPLRTTAGYLYRNGAPTNVYMDGNCSVLVLDSQQRQVSYEAEWIGVADLAAVAAAAAAEPFVEAAEAAQAAAEAAADDAETASDTLFAAADVYADTTAGLAATASGGYFWVPSPEADESFILYLDNAGVAEEVKRLPGVIIVARDVPGYGLVIGSEDYTAIGLRLDGTVDLPTVNGPLKDHAERHAGRRFPAQIIHINGAGQSNGYYRSAAQTTVVEYDNVQFDYMEVDPTRFLHATMAAGEAPTTGTMGAIKQLLEEEDGLTYQVNDFQLCATVNAVSAKTIAELSKGGSTGAYEASITQVASGLAVQLGKTWASFGSTWTQGEADNGAVEATYKAALITYAEEYNTDAKAETGQDFDCPLVTWQVGSNANKSVAVAQWKAANEHPLVFLACPSYQFDYGDFQHLDGTSSKWLGGYYGLALKRILIDGVGWEPLQPTSVQIVGSNIDIYFNKKGLTLDTTLMPSQTSSGFSVENAAAAAQTINSVTVMPGNRVRLAMATTPVADWKVKYGHNAVTGKSPYVGGGGNLRDTVMWEYDGNPMHNWCVIFDWTI